MKYIELYLNGRKEELEKEKNEIIEELKERYKNCIKTEDFEGFVEDCNCDYVTRIDWINMRLDELRRLKEDLILDKEVN